MCARLTNCSGAKTRSKEKARLDHDESPKQKRLLQLRDSKYTPSMLHTAKLCHHCHRHRRQHRHRSIQRSKTSNAMPSNSSVSDFGSPDPITAYRSCMADESFALLAGPGACIVLAELTHVLAVKHRLKSQNDRHQLHRNAFKNVRDQFSNAKTVRTL